MFDVVSEAPSYHTTTSQRDEIPAYVPRTLPENNSRSLETRQGTEGQHQVTGLPPVPSHPLRQHSAGHNLCPPSWSTVNSPAARQYRNVAARRVGDVRYQSRSSASTSTQQDDVHKDMQFRPLEDPYLVGEAAAAQAKRDRIARETGDDILIREDRHWDWLLSNVLTLQNHEYTG